MKRLVKSTDPRKKELLTLFKEKSGGNKVTCVTEIHDNVYTANCFKHLGNRKYEALGTFQVSATFTEETASEESVQETVNNG